jgi:perosamine synthetase
LNIALEQFSIVTSIARFGIKQALNILKLFLGKPVTRPSLGSMTLDKDDVAIARKWLKNKTGWNDIKIVKEYERAFSKWNGSKYCFAFMGGRVALSAIIYGLGLQPGDEVILPGYTCVVVPNAFKFAGVKIIYSDIELETYGLDASIIESKITSKTKAIMLHHLYGLVCRDYETIINIAKKHNLKIIEDCAHATGAEYKGKKVGNYGHAAFYSSEQSKIFNTVQGGIAATNDSEIAKRIQEYYEHAPVPDNKVIERQLYTLILNYYQCNHPARWILGDIFSLIYRKQNLISTTSEEMCGICPSHYGRKMVAPIAAIGMNQLRKIDRYNQIRRETSKIWDDWCVKAGYLKPLVINNSLPVFLRYPVLVEPDKKKNTKWAKKTLGVDLGVWFIGNLHPVQHHISDCPKSDEAVKKCINFPCIL